MIFHRENAFAIEKHKVRMKIYNFKEQAPQAAVAYQETEDGHAEEFYHEKSAFIYYILEGQGTYFIDGEAHAVKATDVVIVPPGKRIYFKGAFKQVCMTAPAWEEAFEHHVRDVDLEAEA